MQKNKGLKIFLSVLLIFIYEFHIFVIEIYAKY
jgi:hypothetical protein